MTRYPWLAILSFAMTFAAVWVWVWAMPMAYMDPEYPSWLAKRVMLDRCDLGEVLILGDSRAAADLVPAYLPVQTTNGAVGGGEPVEAYAALSRALRCPVAPRLVLISFDPGHFMRHDLFWERSVRFGFVDEADLDDLRAAAIRTGDGTVYAGNGLGGLPLPVRDLLERLKFPPLYFASLAHSLGGLRWWRNHRALAATLAARGQYAFGTADGSDAVAVEGGLRDFRPLPVLDEYFDRLLALLAERGIAARFLTMPVNEPTWARYDPAVRDGYRAYLAGYERRYKLFRVMEGLPTHWPNHSFGDQFCHLNPDGAARFTALLAQRLQHLQTERDGERNDAGTGRQSGTAPVAADSATYAPAHR